MFQPAALAQAIQTALAQSPDVPAGARGAFVTVLSPQGVTAGIAVKVGDGWDLKALVTVAPTAPGWTAPSVDLAVAITGTF